jgi:mRNA interferase RelE/StbE
VIVLPFDTAVSSSYDDVRMRYEIVLSPEAVKDFRNLRSHLRATVRDGIEEHLRHEPTRETRSRIRRLRGVSRPQYRLRIGDVRIFYDVSDNVVHVLAIVLKAEAQKWLEALEAEE